MNHNFRQYAFPVMIVLAVLFAVGCAASVEGETDNWKGNIAMVDRLIEEHPNFAAPLGTVKSTAEASWKATEEISDEEQKIEAMQSANAMIDNSFAQKLGDIPLLKSEIEKIRKGLVGKKMSQSLINSLDDAADSADEAIAKCDYAIAQGAEDLGTAESLIGPPHAMLKASRDTFKSLKSSYDKENKKKKKKKKGK